MIPRMIFKIILLAMPAIMLGGEQGKLLYVFKPDIPDTIKGIHIQFEVKLLKVSHQGKTINIYCLCADITNQNDRTERILVRYQCQGNAKAKKVEIGGRQQRIFLVDKCMMAEEYPSDMKKFYRLGMLEFSQ
jgi:hypothetical protein